MALTVLTQYLNVQILFLQERVNYSLFETVKNCTRGVYYGYDIIADCVKDLFKKNKMEVQCRGKAFHVRDSERLTKKLSQIF